jgi:predicted protein tyrosine phosphatase
MLKRIVVGSMLHAHAYRPKQGERYAVLSFLDIGAESPVFPRPEGFVERLVVHADDCTPEDAQVTFEGHTLCPLSERQAQQIARFIQANVQRIDTLVVHCHAGISRSPGAALAIAEALAVAEVEMLNGEQIAPNAHVRSLVSEALSAMAQTRKTASHSICG